MRKFFILSIIFSQLLFVSTASAHRPDNSTNLEITEIQDSQTSFAFYRELTQENAIQVYQLSMQAGEFFHAGINIPQLIGLDDFGVNLALIGPGLPNSNLQTDLAAQGLDTNNPTLKNILNQNTNGMIAESQVSADFYEPFTQTEYWGRQVLELDAPATGTYYLVTWHPEGQTGKYVLDTGTKEIFGFADLFLFPQWWWDAQVYFERGEQVTNALILFGIGLGLGSLMTWWLQRRKIRRTLANFPLPQPNSS